ncbi:TVP38/TMEM64 family protein [Paenibacillus lemnae]|uniref:TVP38/TMEM64 family membrane protein n=2 Tax=Paenibacillus lemnae TaxID=1330551 RepID=A0A848MEH9_PAELE|nr:VTT domain-containing protein [Paenibacillus lemnae]NMO97794.1 TVP38/TMEM64 family protein [Paenibacillus lemnae]
MMSLLNEEALTWFLETFRSLGPLPGILITFMKSFVPPLPTAFIVGLNAAVYGFWPGFLYSWFGIITGCMVTFWIIRKVGDAGILNRWASKPKVVKGMHWIRKNGFSYVFLLSILPVGPFVAVNIAAGLGRMRMASYLAAIIPGKGLMVLLVSFVGANFSSFITQPPLLAGLVFGIFALMWISKKVETYILGKQAMSETKAEM